MLLKDHYQTLRVSEKATPQEIQKAFRQLALDCHPDVAGDTGIQRFLEIREAYETLICADTRRRYDAERTAFIPPVIPVPQPAAAPFHKTPAYKVSHPKSYMARVILYRPAVSSYDIEAVLELTMEETIRPAIFSLDLRNDLSSPDQVLQYPVAFPGRLWNGATLCVQGLGYYDPARRTHGNLYIEIQIKHHPLFRTEKTNVHHRLTLAPWDIALGQGIDTPTLDGWQMFRVSQDTFRTSEIILRERGLFDSEGRRGDFVIHLHLTIETPPTRKARHLWTQLAKAYDRFQK